MTDFDPNEFPSLQKDLKRLADPQIEVSPALDSAILSAAKRSFIARRRSRMIAQRIGAGLAAAAVLAIAIRIFVPFSHGPITASHPTELARAADVNHDGRVDILDAYTVARAIARHQPLDPAWDINGDGVVDQKDVDLLANMAVQTGSGAKQ